MSELDGLHQSALEIFHSTRAAIDVERVVRGFLTIDGNSLLAGSEGIDLDDFPTIVAIGIGKACQAMARAIGDTLGSRLSRGFIATNALVGEMPRGFDVILGGHPVPDQGSLEAASKALELLHLNDSEQTLVIFMITGGGSALFERPIDPSITVSDLRLLNSVLVGCGAVIGEINVVRRHLSAVKGGRLAEAARRSRQISLYISDVNDDDLTTVASGPTLPGNATLDDFHRVIESYSLLEQLPRAVVRLIEKNLVPPLSSDARSGNEGATRTHHLLLDNRGALLAAKEIAERQGFVVEIADDLVEAEVGHLARQHLERLFSLKSKYRDRKVCLLSGGEAICPVRGSGRGGRNQEFVLRALLEPAMQERQDIVVLSAGTDGIDGNSPAAGAIVDLRMILDAETRGFSAREYLENSDSYAFLDAVGGTIVTGATGNNVRDLRVLLCS